MKKTGLTAACLLLIWMLLWIVPVCAENAVPAGEEASAPRNIIIMPFASSPDLYPKADQQGLFMDTFIGLLQLLPGDGTASYSVYAMDDKNDVFTASPAETAAHISMERRQGAKPSEQIARIKTKNPKADDVLFILDCSSDYDASEWKGLADLAEYGVRICFVEIRNERNAKKTDSFISGFSLTEITPNLMQENGSFTFCWVENTTETLDALLPIMQPLFDEEYQKMNETPEGVSEILPFFSLTDKTRLLLQWVDSQSENGENSIQTDGKAEMVYGNGAFAIIDVSGNARRIDVPLSASGSVYYWSDEKEMDQISLNISKTTDKEFSRNEQNIYEVSLQGKEIDVPLFNEDLDSHDIQMVLKREDSSFAVPMTWNEDDRKWTTTVTYNQGGSWNVCAEADLGGDRVIKSETDVTQVKNHLPVVELDASLESTAENPVGTAENPIRIWVNNPWDESTRDAVSIPLHIQDKDNDVVELKANGEKEHFVTNLGTVTFSETADEEAGMLISLNKVGGNQQIAFDTPFSIVLQGSDGQEDSVPMEITFVLQDMSAALGQVTVSELALNDQQPKKKDFEVSFTVDASAFSEPDRLLAAIKEHADYQIALSDDDPVPMLWKEDSNVFYVTLRANNPGERTITVTEPANLPVPASKTIRIKGSSPTVLEVPQDVDEEIEKDGDALRWDSVVFRGKDMFTDTDEDDFTVIGSVTNADERSYTLEQVTGSTDPVIYEVRSGTPEAPTEIAGDLPFKLRFAEEGDFTIRFTAKDEDGESDPVSVDIRLMTRWNKILGLVKKYAPYAAAGLVLILILSYFLKPSFKGKTVQVTATTADLEQTLEIPLDEWKKGTKPFWQLLTCALVPPEPELFQRVSKVQVKPCRKGIRILKAAELTGRNRVTVDSAHPMTVQSGEVSLSIAVK